MMLKNTSATPHRWLSAGLLVACAGLMPLGLANAGPADHEAVHERLRQAIDEGELSTEQARAMMQALKRIEYAEAEEKVKNAVREGHATKEQAAQRLEQLRKHLFGEEHRHDHDAHEHEHQHDEGRGHDHDKAHDEAMVRGARERMAFMRKELEAAVKAGKITQNEAEQKLHAAGQEIRAAIARDREEHGQHKITHETLRLLMERHRENEQKLKALIEKGEITEADALRRLEGGRREIERMSAALEEDAHEERRRQRYEAGVKRLEELVESGEITKEQARARLERMRIAMERSLNGAPENARSNEAEQDERVKVMNSVRAALQQAVEAGGLSQDEADKTLVALRTKLFTERGGGRGGSEVRTGRGGREARSGGGGRGGARSGSGTGGSRRGR